MFAREAAAASGLMLLSSSKSMRKGRLPANRFFIFRVTNESSWIRRANGSVRAVQASSCTDTSSARNARCRWINVLIVAVIGWMPENWLPSGPKKIRWREPRKPENQVFRARIFVTFIGYAPSDRRKAEALGFFTNYLQYS